MYYICAMLNSDTHGTFKPEERDFKVSREAPLASTIQQPTAEMAPQPPALVYPKDGKKPGLQKLV